MPCAGPHAPFPVLQAPRSGHTGSRLGNSDKGSRQRAEQHAPGPEGPGGVSLSPLVMKGQIMNPVTGGAYFFEGVVWDKYKAVFSRVFRFVDLIIKAFQDILEVCFVCHHTVLLKKTWCF